MISPLRRYALPIRLWLALRVGLSLWLGLVWLVVDRYTPPQGEFQRETYGRLVPSASLVGRAAFDVWLRWDGVHYMNLAAGGYAAAGPADANYPPLYPYLARALLGAPPAGSAVPAAAALAAGLLVSSLAGLAAFCLFHELALAAYGDADLARWSLLAFACYPTAFFLFAPYTEALYTALALGAFLAVERRRWLLAGLLACLAGLTRVQGILLLPALAAALLEFKALGEARQRLAALGGLALAPLGYLAFEVWRFGRGLSGLSASLGEFSAVIFVDPLSGLWLALRQAVQTGELLPVSELLSVLLFMAVFGWLLAQPRLRSRRYLLVYAAGLLLLILSKHSVQASALQSANRYVLGVLPVFFGMGGWLQMRPPAARRLLLAFSLGGLLAASAVYALWFFVG
jgi:hypothetical protein